MPDEARHPGSVLERPAAALHRVLARGRRAVGRSVGAPDRPTPARRWRWRSSPWRVAVAEESMSPAIEAGDWLLVDPTIRHWPRRGTIVLFREPGSDLLVIKRVVGRPGDSVPTERGLLTLAAGEAWLQGDAPASHDSRHYGPVLLDRLVGRVWFRYGPLHRIGRVQRSSDTSPP